MEAVFDIQPILDLTEDQFYEICQRNHDARLERNAGGEILIMPPTGGITGDRNSEINMQLRLWAKQNGTGIAFDSSTGFRLPNNAIRSPDGSWVLLSRYNQLTNEQKERFLPLYPDFVIELKSPTDHLPSAKEKMEEYIENGVQLGWLIEPTQRTVYIYRPHLPVETQENLNALSANPTLSGFELDLTEIW